MSPPSATDPKERFSDRVASYVSYRPSYPPEIARILHGLLSGSAPVADVGSGTGISSELLLAAGFEVFAVEPNPAMRAAAEAALGGNPRFRSVAGSAEATTLPDRSVDLVLCAQAFHWFDPIAARREFARILRPPGHVALLWNDRQHAGSPFLEGYEALLQTLPEYGKVKHHNITADPHRFDAFFTAGKYTLHSHPNHQDLDESGFLGRAFSSSYTPKPNTPEHARFEAALRDLFRRTHDAGTVRMPYITQLFVGTVH